MRALLMSSLLLSMLAAAPASLANPIACEQRGDVGIAEDGTQVVASFLGMCEDAATYDELLAVQVQLDGDWSILEGGWQNTGPEQAEGGSGVETYSVFEQAVDCPAAGPYEFRVAWIDSGGLQAWYGERIECAGRGGGCATAPRAPTGLGALGLALLGLAATLRRWRP